MAYITPCDAFMSSSWQDHKNRSTPSAEPGTDYACGYGTNIRAAEAGVIAVVHSAPTTAMGRHVTINLDDGRVVRYLHLSQTLVSVGQRVTRGQIIARSGASAGGSDYGSGVHVHVSLWASRGQAVGDTIDFERYLGETTNPTGFLMALTDRQQEEIYNIIAGTQQRPFGRVIAEELLRYKIARAGSPMTGEVDLAALIAWSDNNRAADEANIKQAIAESAHALATHVTNTVNAS